jgi:L-iditol 2-dehydrogenase
MSEKMKAARLHGVGDLRVDEVDRPELQNDDDVLIRIHACGICPSDLRAYMGQRKRRSGEPYTPGHEWAGEIIDAGDAVEGYTVGDRVAPSWRVMCGECHYCVRGMANYCEKLDRGRIHGGFCEYGVAPYKHMARVPDGTSSLAACFCEPVACCINGNLDTRIKMGDFVAIVGSGPIGLTHVMLAKHAGARVVVSDVIQSRLDKALEVGADGVINAASEDPVARIKELTGGYGADCVITAMGIVKAQAQALDMVDIGGRVNFFAGTYPSGSFEMDPNHLHYRTIHVTGSHDYTPRHFEIAMDYISMKTVDVAALVSHELPLADVQSGFETVKKQEGLKVIIRMHQEGDA